MSLPTRFSILPFSAPPAVAAFVLLQAREPGLRIGVISWMESGYRYSDADDPTRPDDYASSVVQQLNKFLGLPEEIRDSAVAASMFGWDQPVGQPAIQYYKQRL
jgi:hypothetical protein